MTKEKIEYMSNVPKIYHSKISGIWKDAFDEYNEDHKDDRPMNMDCISCYRKVYFYLRKKYQFE